MSTQTITEFLEARIADDEARASSGWARLGDSRWETTDYGQDFLTPSAVLAECAAKRAIIGDHELVAKMYLKDYCSTCADWENSELGEGPPGVEHPCPTVQALAAVYKDHADYREEWAL